MTETHLLADYLSSSRELALATDAALYLSDEGGPDWLYNFDHIKTCCVITRLERTDAV